MIFPVTSDVEILTMDEMDYREHLLLSALDDKPLDNSSLSALSDSTPSLMEEDDNDSDFLDTEKVGEIFPDSIIMEEEKKTPVAEKRSGNPGQDGETPTRADPAKVDIPCKFDILCGQSRICANHTGNRRFQVVLDIYAPKYDAATSKQEKMTLTKEIVASIGNAGGRFLKYKDGLWVEIPTVTARDKVSHALRTKVASLKRQLEQARAERLSASSSPDGGKKSRPTHRKRRSSSAIRRRRSSTSTATTVASDIVTSSFDSRNSASSVVLGDLLRAQREIFANLTSDNHPLKKY